MTTEEKIKKQEKYLKSSVKSFLKAEDTIDLKFWAVDILERIKYIKSLKELLIKERIKK